MHGCNHEGKVHTYKLYVETRSPNYCCHGRVVSITYSECVCVCVSVALVIQHAKCMRPVMFSSVSCQAPPYFNHVIS
jgi:hypothetical protein